MLDERARDDMAIVREMLSISSEVARLSGRFTALTDEFCRRVEGRPQADDPIDMDRRAADWNGSLEPIPQFLPGRDAQANDAPPERSPAVQDDEAAGASPEQGSGATEVQDGLAEHTSQPEQVVAVVGAGERTPSRNDPAPWPDAKSVFDQVLDLWAETDMPHSEIARRVRCAPGTPKALVSKARRTRDHRAQLGDARRGKAPGPTTAQLSAEIEADLPGLFASNPTGLTYAVLQDHYGVLQDVIRSAMIMLELKGIVRRTNLDRVRWWAPEAQPAETAPAAAPAAAPVQTEPSPPRQVPEIERRVPRHVESDEITTLVPARRKELVKPIAADHCVRASAPARSEELHLVPVTPFMAIDETANVVAGPKGEWQTHRPCVLTLRRLGKLQPGQFLDAAQLAGTAIDKRGILDSMPVWQRELGRIGIEVVKVGREMFALKAAA